MSKAVEAEKTFDEMLVEIRPRLFAWALLKVRHRAYAEDLVQQAMYRALRGRDQFMMGTNFDAWMHRILRNEMVSSWRKSRRLGVQGDMKEVTDYATEGDAFWSSTRSNQEDAQYGKELLNIIDNLPECRREVAKLILVQGYDYAEAAEICGVTIGTIKSRLWRARAAIIKQLNKEGQTDVHIGGCPSGDAGLESTSHTEECDGRSPEEHSRGAEVPAAPIVVPRPVNDRPVLRVPRDPEAAQLPRVSGAKGNIGRPAECQIRELADFGLSYAKPRCPNRQSFCKYADAFLCGSIGWRGCTSKGLTCKRRHYTPRKDREHTTRQQP